MPKNKFINLLPQEEFEASMLGRVLKWAMTTFRYIVIVTEMVVMGAFLSRFWLDSRNSDLNDLLTIRSAEIGAQSDFENKFKNLQAKLKIFEGMTESTKSSDIITKITTRVPLDVTLQSVSLENASAQIKGLASSELSIAQFISNLDGDKFFSGVELGQVSSSENNPSLTVFTISTKF